jgi:hypothetical protein
VADEPLPGEPEGKPFSFLKGVEDVLAERIGKSLTWDQRAAKVREHLTDAMNARHVAFLFGSGCSSYVTKKVEFGIPTMATMAEGFAKAIGVTRDGNAVTADEHAYLRQYFGIDITATKYQKNLEALMEVLLSLHFVARTSEMESLNKGTLGVVESIIKKVTTYILITCTQGLFSWADDSVANLYQSFYRKLIYRDRSLPRPWIFTTNYDLFNETAMDRLSVPYSNGFSGTVERRFNPANFRYSLGEQLDISNRKWTVADSFVYLCKLHGSINWVEDIKGLFPIRELQTPSSDRGRVMIYPTPAKQAASLGSPYTDLFREFQSRIVRDQSVLFVLGYSFSDEHVNNIIFQALTVPTFRMIAFVSPDSSGVPEQLRNLGDRRIWMIGGAGPSSERKAHYFDTFVEHFMPEPPGDKVDKAIGKVLDTLLKASTNQEPDDHAGG